MKSFLASIDVNDPQATLWGTTGCKEARVLVRAGSHPLDELRIPLNPSHQAISIRQLKPWIAPYLPTAMTGEIFEDVVPAPITVIVCTRDRHVLLGECLDRLKQLRHSDLEVVVVDNAPRSGETRRVVMESGFRYVREDRPGLNWARNCGWKHATNDIVAYIDDDACADEFWLEGICRGFRDPDTAAVTGLVLPAELQTRAQHLFESYGNGMSKGMSPRTFGPGVVSPVMLIRSQDVGVGANMAYRKAVLEELGGFDTALDVGTPSAGGGDLDMFHRVMAAGHKIAYEPSALVRHRHRRDMEGLIQQIRNNGRSFGVYLIKLWRTSAVPRKSLISFAFWTWGRWLVGRPLKRLFRRQRLPMRMLLAELIGALGAPAAFLATYRSDRAIRQNAHPPNRAQDPSNNRR